MKVTIEKLPESKIKLKIEVPIETVDRFLDKAYSELSKNINVSGFRPGHIPRILIDQKIGSRAVHEEAIRLLIPHAYVEAISKEKIMALGRPEIKVTKFAPGNPAEFEAEVAVIPEVELSNYKNIKVEKKDIKIEDTEIEDVLKSFQKREAKLSPKDGKLEKGDWVEIDFDGFKNGIVLEKLKSRNHPLITGEGVFLPEFEENIIGLQPGGEKEFDLKFTKDYFDKDLAGESIHFKLKVLKVQKVDLPEINDEFVQKISQNTAKNLNELKKDIKDSLLEQKQYNEKSRKENEVVQQLIEQSKVDVPEVLVSEEVEQMKKNLEQRLETQGLKLPRYLEHLKKTEEQLKEDLKEEAQKRIKAGLILSKIADKENIKVKDQEIKQEIQKVEKEAVEKNQKAFSGSNIEKEEFRRYIKTVLLNRRTLDKLLEYAKKK